MSMPDWSNWEQTRLLVEAELKAKMDYFEWRDLGIFNGWISEPFCDTHDAGYLTEEEEKEWEEGGDPCMPVFRIWEDKIEQDSRYQMKIFEE